MKNKIHKPQAVELRENTNYKYTRNLTKILDIFNKILCLLIAAGGIIGAIVSGQGEALFLILVALIYFVIGKLAMEVTNMMTDVADSNISMVTKLNELITIQEFLIAEKNHEQLTSNKKTSVKSTHSTENISDFDSGAPPIV